MDYDYEVIYKEYFSKVYLYVLTISHDEHIAEEITQETFFKALEKIETFNGDCKLYTWLCQIAKNALYDFYKISIYSMLYYINKDEREKEIEKIIKDFTLESMLRKKANELSLGVLQKLKLAISFMTNSNIVILDEPFNGLDIESTVILKEKIQKAKEEQEVIDNTKLTRELMEKYIDSVFCEGNEVLDIVWK